MEKSKKFIVRKGGFVYRIVNKLTAQRIFISDGGETEVFAIHDNDSETSITSLADFETFDNDLFGIEVGYVADMTLELQRVAYD